MNFATHEFPSLHPQNHHPDEKVVNPQFFAQLIFWGCKPFSCCKTLQNQPNKRRKTTASCSTQLTAAKTLVGLLTCNLQVKQ
jgi:hypothetical protein